MNGKSRIVVFTWDPDRTQGPSVYCQSAGNCDQTYVYKRYNENGSEVQSTSIRLDHVVNVIDVTGTENGWVSIWDIPVNANSAKFQTYAFSINSASSASISTNWDAILESYIDLGSGASAADTNRRQR